MDVFTPEKRSEVMSNIRGKANKSTELILVKEFRRCGIKGWRRHQDLPGKPDFYFPKKRVAVFVDGCFWHGCPTHYIRPVTNRSFWDKKLVANIHRDKKVRQLLSARNVVVVRVWEHSLKTKRGINQVLRKIRQHLSIG